MCIILESHLLKRATTKFLQTIWDVLHPTTMQYRHSSLTLSNSNDCAHFSERNECRQEPRAVANGYWEVCDTPLAFFIPKHLQNVAKTTSKSGEYPQSDTVWSPTLPLKNPGYALGEESRSSFTEWFFSHNSTGPGPGCATLMVDANPSFCPLIKS